MAPAPLRLQFLGSGNAFGAQGRAFSSFLVNGRYLFDCGPTVLQQLHKLAVLPGQVEVVLVSHFHADHYFGLPFLLLDARYGGGRSTPLSIVGPPGVEAQTEALLRLAYPDLAQDQPDAPARRYVEVQDGGSLQVDGLGLRAARVEHVRSLECYAYRAEIDGRSLVYSGDTTLCGGLLSLVPGADVVVLECSSRAVAVHLSPEGVAAVARAAPGARILLTHLDADMESTDRLTVAQDLASFEL